MKHKSQKRWAHPGGTLEGRPPRRWYHWKLFPKFALMFFLVVAIPVMLIAMYVSYQSKALILDSVDQVTPEVVAFVEEVSEHQLQDNNDIIARTTQGMQQDAGQMLSQITANYRKQQETIYEKVLTTLTTEMQRVLDDRFRAGNRDLISQEIVHIIGEGFSEYATALNDELEQSISDEHIRFDRTFPAILQRTKAQVRVHAFNEQESLRQAVEKLVSQNMHAVAEKVSDKASRNILPIIVLIGILSIGMGILVAGYVINPINQVTAVASHIAQGNVDHDVPIIHSHDELGQLSQSFRETTHYLRRMVQGARNIAEGNFTTAVEPLSAHDALGTAFQQMVTYLREIAALATAISHGDIRPVVAPKSEGDVLGQAIHRMTIYLQRIAQVARKVAGGDLSEHSQPQSEKDVLGNVFADMISRLRHLVSKIRLEANQLVVMSQESQHRTHEETESVEKISLSVEETTSSMTQMAMSIEEVNENMQSLASFVGETSSSIEEMTSSIRQIVLHSEQLASASEETSASIQEISASLQQFAKTAQHSKQLSDGARQDAIDGREAVEKMIRSMKEIQLMATETAETIRSLNTRTESVERILGVIKDISDQTSLLSINASIIAKKAGERGRGFTVIADKVRKLAERSNTSAKEIALIIRDVRREAAHAVEVVTQGYERVQEGATLAELAGQALEKIISGANESSSVVSMIAETTGEQTRISQHIMESMDQVVEMVNQIKKATMEQEKSSSYIMQQAEQILLSSKQVKQSTSEQTEVVKHVSLAMDDVRSLIQMTSERTRESAQAASMLSQRASALKRLVSQFTI